MPSAQSMTTFFKEYITDIVYFERNQAEITCMRHTKKHGPISVDCLDEYLHSWCWRYNKTRAGLSFKRIVDDTLKVFSEIPS